MVKKEIKQRKTGNFYYLFFQERKQTGLNNLLLVFRYKIVHVRFSFSEFHLIHTLTSVPMQESLATEHGSELLADTLEHLLDGGGVTDEGGAHAHTGRSNL